MLSSNASSVFSPLWRSDFGRMMCLAALLHVVALAAIFAWPKQQVEEIPVRTLNISLGGDLAQLAAPPPAMPKMQVPAPTSKPKETTAPKAPAKLETKETSFKKKPAAEAKPKPEKRRAPAQQAPEAAATVKPPSQFVRPAPAAVSSSSSSGSGSEVLTPEQAIKRYEQTMSAWLQRHRVVPELARSLGQYGSPVLRVQISRAGAVKYFAIERSSGYQLIDDAAMDMVRRANPFPAPPASYPGGQVLEFLIPVTFDLQ